MDPFIVAEVGSNWLTLADCLLSIDEAAKAGADAVKFQAFRSEAMYGPLAEARKSQWELPLSWLPELARRSEAAGIEFMCTAFSPELVAAIDPFVKRHKVASSDATTPHILEAVRATGKQVLFSTGALTLDEVALAWITLQDDAGRMSPPTVILYCVAAYPARSVDLRQMVALRSRCPGALVGYSDHTTDIIQTPLTAVTEYGAVVVEKHFTAITAPTPDHGHSLSPMEFSLMVDALRGRQAEVPVSKFTDEAEMMALHKRRVVAIRDIAEGETFTEANCGCYRARKPCEDHVSPFRFKDLTSGERKAAHPIKAGSSVRPQDIG